MEEMKKMQKKVADIIYIICLIIGIVVFISFIISEYNYNDTYNIWREREDDYIGIIFAVIGVAIFICVPMIYNNRRIKKSKPERLLTKMSPDIIRINSTYLIGGSILGIVIFLIISEDMVFRFGYNELRMDLAEARFFACGYQIFENHFLIIEIVTLIENIITYFTADSQIDPNEGKSSTFCRGCGSKLPENSVFCFKCGKQILAKMETDTTVNTVKRCPDCGDILKWGRCEMCGKEVK